MTQSTPMYGEKCVYFTNSWLIFESLGSEEGAFKTMRSINPSESHCQMFIKTC